MDLNDMIVAALLVAGALLNTAFGIYVLTKDDKNGDK